MWSAVVKWTCLPTTNDEKKFSTGVMISLSGSVKGDWATILSQLQLKVCLPTCSWFVAVVFFKVSVWSARQLWKTMAGVILSANTISRAAATIFCMIWFLNKV